MNRYPFWKYLLIIVALGVGVVYSLPNLYGKEPALQISPTGGQDEPEILELKVEAALEEAEIEPQSLERRQAGIVVRLPDEETQRRARDAIGDVLGRDYVVALSLAPAAPAWLRALSAEPMFLGLDLRGGVHFLMEVDMDAALRKAAERYISDLRASMREERIHYRGIVLRSDNRVFVRLRDTADMGRARSRIQRDFPELEVEEGEDKEGNAGLLAGQGEESLKETRRFALQQNITTLRKRVNELGIAEPVVQQQGEDRIVVQLPGVQDTARAKEILGATATLEFRLVDEENSPEQAESSGRAPVGSRLYRSRDGGPILLEKDIIITGDRIIAASSGFDQVSGSPAVFITLDGKGARLMSRKTADHVGDRMGVVYIETQSWTERGEDGEETRRKEVIEEVINAAVIREQLGKRFQITGLDSPREARNLALLLRAGALAAPVQIIEERTVGPSLGQDNIDQGFRSIQIGLTLVLIFMALYYRFFGLVADLALVCNLMLIVALLSMLQATLTLPGIAGIVLTVGMAVDANVLIFERIREELRNGNSPQASIHAGYGKALSTIADANITTLIAALVLFNFGTGPIKGFAVTLSLGILTSMFTSIVVSRGVVNLWYGRRQQLRRLSI
ncbi:MAG: protein translocase subunit SecD [Gammaproteobacteria bacterium]|nr:protein translocase subunit SecD [Gammaproteobacteria bacterium]MDD9823677.1 protein translocase subunit SecD [Gammaproteobacteria bacterium]MDD9863672.1 protein translocase subunit SecD [Gammaproteobacteria bacterium]